MNRSPKSLILRKAAMLLATTGCAAALVSTVAVTTHDLDAAKSAHSTTALAGDPGLDEWNSQG
ncbi:hypothetical protein ACFXDH_37790 [Streptomyces sp. NPDC059467]|uniref:hypothetical protein n=1 Tax=Streptomyces sp. NPDC059467 TaxID=3346844 RepID=UPI0036A925A1